MEDAKQYHQYSNFLLKEKQLLGTNFKPQVALITYMVYLVIIGHNIQSEPSSNVSNC
jgi:hypothetical protein